MDKSFFTDKQKSPGTADLVAALGDTYDLWQTLADHVRQEYPEATDEWKYSSNGWSFRIKDKKRVIIYLLPRNRFFKVAFVFGQKATDQIMKSGIADEIRKELAAAKVYAEGRGIRIAINNGKILDDIRQLIDIKLAN